MSVLRKEMEKYRDIDEDELLKKLSEEELQRLEDELEELDPDVSLYFRFPGVDFLPPCLCQGRVMRAPTGYAAVCCVVIYSPQLYKSEPQMPASVSGGSGCVRF